MHVKSNLKALRTAIPYIRAYKDHVFVVKLGGLFCEPGQVLDNLVEQLSLLHQLNVRLVIVHGGGEQADALSRRLNIVPQCFAGRRITDDETLEVAKMAFAGTANTNLVAAFRRTHVPAVGLSGVDAELLVAEKRPLKTMTDPATGETRDVDFGQVGDITEVSVGILNGLLEGGYVPVVCSLAADRQGRVYNVNADTVASRIAIEIGAAKYFVATNVDGVLCDANNPATLQSQLDIDQLHELIESGAISGGMLPKLAACIDAIKGGVPRVHIINGNEPDTILAEVFTNEGCGTLLVPVAGQT